MKKFILNGRYLVEAKDSREAWRMGLALRAKFYHPDLSFQDAVLKEQRPLTTCYPMSVVEVPEELTEIEPISEDDAAWFDWRTRM